MRLSTTPPFVRPTAQTPASAHAAPKAADEAREQLPPPLPAKDAPRAATQAKRQSTDLTGDASLHKIMEAYRRGHGVDTDSSTPPSRPKLLTQDSSFGEMMQVARMASEGTQPAATDFPMSAQERAVRRVAAKVKAWWQAKVGERRWLAGGRRAAPSTAPASAPPAAAPTGAAPR